MEVLMKKYVEKIDRWKNANLEVYNINDNASDDWFDERI
jgi:hypothetical protein